MKKKDKVHSEIIATALQEIEKQQAVMAVERDKLRVMVGDLEGLVDSWDQGLEDLGSGLYMLQQALDSLSEYV